MTVLESHRHKSPWLFLTRWCCDSLKKDPSRPRRLKALIGQELRSRIMGIRAEESVMRAARPRINSFDGVTHIKPIYQWAEWHVWEYIDSRGLAYPSLYDEGFERIGCVVCPFILGGRKLQKHRDRWPGLYRIFERVVTDWHDNHRTAKARVKYQGQTAAEYLEAYYSERLIYRRPGLELLKAVGL